jgi:hypothetical protein
MNPRTFSDRGYTLCIDCIEEIYGPLTPRDFNSHSANDWVRRW